MHDTSCSNSDDLILPVGKSYRFFAWHLNFQDLAHVIYPASIHHLPFLEMQVFGIKDPSFNLSFTALQLSDFRQLLYPL